MLDEGALSLAHPADAGSPLGNLEWAGLLPARAHGLVLRKTLLLQEQFIPAGAVVCSVGVVLILAGVQ